MVSDKIGPRQLLQGNEAIVEGALAAGCRFFAGYPITPASEIAELMSLRLPALNGTFIQMEDEIAGMGAIIGASLAGVKSLTATSGPGFSLLQENLGFACAAEVPCVVVNVMRAGPSTGLSTSPAQGDVMQARWGTHGDHPVIVLAVSTVNDCFTIIVQAFNLAEKYRVPVIVLSDEIVAHTRETVVLTDPAGITVIDRTRPAVPPEWYIPYEDNSRGVPAMAAMGSGYRHHVTGLIHDVRGFPTERPEEVDAFIRRLFRKITNGFAEIQMTNPVMLEDAEIAVIAYGAVSRSALRAVRLARSQGIRAGLLQLITLFPFPRKAVETVLRQCRRVLVPEMNMGQMIREVKRVNRDTEIVRHNRVDGQFITPDEIYDHLLAM
ncbi:MAG: 2-oxoacid:acceptor oxidoreductase subunit alpha [Proteobacteria bacterium]|nr:2-oxoacid:acceptor oxidoreductase subunit alpha [Pseudomonadota bacterium]MBU4296377.1 2-oxoacid:acceptor oxidoreductase subunit alpha [Pseudomonadota bacterium]MCG2750061.1 2-oxoacid:acceptor oxidoreductase subunit alpha [Desulfobulbaceae bacterium]